MSYTGDPSSNTIDAVRFRIGDTDEEAEEVTDVEIQFLLDLNGDDTGRAALQAVRSLAAKYAKKRDRSVGPIAISYDGQFQRWLQLAESLKEEVRFGVTGTKAAAAAAWLSGGGPSFLGPDDTPLTYNEGDNTEVSS